MTVPADTTGAESALQDAARRHLWRHFAPIGEEEHMLARWLSAQFGRASNERVLCGDGLSHIDAMLRATGGKEARTPLTLGSLPLRHPADIVTAALDGHDMSARQALARFCAVLPEVVGRLRADAGVA